MGHFAPFVIMVGSLYLQQRGVESTDCRWKHFVQSLLSFQSDQITDGVGQFTYKSHDREETDKM